MERRVDIYLETEGEGDNCDNGGDEVQYISELDLSLARKNLFLYPINFGSSYTGADITVFEQISPVLSKENKSLLEGVLDDCLESNDEPVTGKKCTLTYKHQLLEKMLPGMAEGPQLRQLLRHPVAATFLNLKWQQVKLFYFSDVVFYVIFLLILTAYILFLESNNRLTNKYTDNNSDDPESDGSPHFLFYLLMVSLGLLTTREIFQLCIYRRMYILSLENWLEILLILVTSVSCSSLLENVETRRHFFAVAVLMGWFELVLLSGKLPLLSVQLEMLRTVALTFLKFMIGYFLLLVAFVLAFYILFKESFDAGCDDLFCGLFRSLLNTTVMFAGEFDTCSLSFDTAKYTSHVIFLLFVFLVSIILLNLLNGLAVSDTEKIRKNGETLSLVARVRLISKIETLLHALPNFTVLKKFRRVTIVLHPNSPNSIEPTAIRSLYRIISNRRRPCKKSKSMICQEKWSLLTEKLMALEKQLHLKAEETQQTLMQILTRLDVRESDI
ncbi:hypothetical protein Cfor_09675 [Coptotermes formosanus]|uniref:Ion transport domain-containing protein n=1 Tax=Coptotermes formosanus TaxID=36987 RepID=A0A6L2PE35_COPFO|nr:hypothetical protein Cfor_09675 [Coptotermes formosanus]